MQIKMDNSTLRAASASMFLFTFTVSALHNLIRQIQMHTTVHGGKGPSFLPAVPPHVLHRETASMRLEESACLRTPCTSLLPYPQATGILLRRKNLLISNEDYSLPTPKCTPSMHLLCSAPVLLMKMTLLLLSKVKTYHTKGDGEG